MVSSTTDTALGYAALGLRVIPLQDKSKVPRIRDWRNRATVHSKTIRSWFKKWPGSNLGIVTGNGLVAVDIDTAKGGVESFNKLVKGRKLPFTAVANTGSDGYHYLFRVEPTLRVGNRVGVRPGIDIRGEGGQIAVEPSIHPATGRAYRWIVGPEQAVADIPKWLLKVITETPEREPVPVRQDISFTRCGEEAPLIRQVIDRFPVKSVGQRNAQMVRAVASLLGRGYDPRLTQTVVTAWWEHYHALGVIGTHPSEASREVPACINSMMKSPKFKQSRGVDHRARCGQIEMDEQQRRMIEQGIVNEDGLGMPSLTSNRGTHGLTSLCTTLKERAFVEALVVYFTYKVHVLNEAPLKATRDQIRQIVEDRHGIKLENIEFARLKTRYITRPDRPATRFELAVQTREGQQGVPSEYRLTGLLRLISPGASTSLVEPSSGAAACLSSEVA